MRKMVLLLAAGTLAMIANAQYTSNPLSDQLALSKKSLFQNASCARYKAPYNLRKSRVPVPAALPFYTQDFSSGTISSLPAGWTAGTIAGGTWKWANTASGSYYSIGAINSPTAANGWMIFDSDSIGEATGMAPEGWLQSPAIDCSGQGIISIGFKDYYRKLKDSCSVWVSTDSMFSTYQDFPVALNDNLPDNMTTPNAATVQINITSVAAWQPVVYLRFYTKGPVEGAYSWLIDDLSLFRPYPNDIGIYNSFIFEPEATAYTGSIFNTPLAFVDNVYPETKLANYGNFIENNVYLVATVYLHDTIIYGNSSFYSGLNINSFDTLISFPYFQPVAEGQYLCAFSASVLDDIDTADKQDTLVFNVTDTVWQQNAGPVTGSTWLHKAAGRPCTFMQGVRFDVPNNSAGDTVSGFGVVFDSASESTNPGATVRVQLYSTSAGGGGWFYLGSSVARPVTGADISDTGVFWAYFQIDASAGIAPFVLQPGYTYCAIVQEDSVNTDLLLSTTGAPNGTGNYIGYLGQEDTSFNDGIPDFSPFSTATGISNYVPMVRMYFGNISVSDGLKTTAAQAIIPRAYPDPAYSAVNIPFVAGPDGKVIIVLTDITGQTVATRDIYAPPGQPGKANFDITGLMPGVYVYYISTNNNYYYGKITIAH